MLRNVHCVYRTNLIKLSPIGNYLIVVYLILQIAKNLQDVYELVFVKVDAYVHSYRHLSLDLDFHEDKMAHESGCADF